MQEVAFVRRNAARWKEFEHELALTGARSETTPDPGNPIEPDRLADLFVEITDDLSYANTFFPGSKTAQYLNGLAGQVHTKIYKNKKEERSRFVRYWAYEIPAAVRSARRELVLALSLFLFSLLIGVVSTLNDEGYTRLILGDAYVNMTLENIRKGDPLGVYRQMSPFPMALAITANNIAVAFKAYVYGILFSVGTAYILFNNGVMLGAFQAMFYRHDLLITSLLVIYIHGALEISSIVIAGGAGFVLGNSFLFPGTYTRLESLRRGARTSLKIVLGLVPLFIVAGTLEGFVTRYTDMPLFASLSIIGGSLFFVAWYFVWLPFHLKPLPRH